MKKTNFSPAQWWKAVEDFSEQCALLRESNFDWPISDHKIETMFIKFYQSFPETVEIETSHEINIGDTFVYTAEPRGTGMFPPKIGTEWEIKTQDDVIHLSIEMIERGRGWKKKIKHELLA